MTRAYRIELSPDDNGTLLATCPALPEVTSFGEDAASARLHAREAIAEALAARIARGEAIPAGDEDGEALPLLAALKIELYEALRAARLTRADLVRRLGWNRESVDRLFRLDHASRTDQLEAAFAAIGMAVDVRVVGRGG